MQQKPYNIVQAARHLNISTRTLRRYIQAGRFEHLIVLEHRERTYCYLTEASLQGFLERYKRGEGARAHYKPKG